MIDFLPNYYQRKDDFVEFLSQPDIMYEYAYLVMMVLPGERANYYRTSNIAAMRASIFDYNNDLTGKLGFYVP